MSKTLLSYTELAKRFYIALGDYCQTQEHSNLYKKFDKVNTMELNCNLNSLNDVVFGLKQQEYNKEATDLDKAIENVRQAIELHNNGKTTGTRVIRKVALLRGELEKFCRPNREQKKDAEKPAETERNTTPAKIFNIKNFKGILGDVQAENVQTGNHASIHKQTVTAEKKKGILGTIGAIIAFILKILWPK